MVKQLIIEVVLAVLCGIVLIAAASADEPSNVIPRDESLRLIPDTLDPFRPRLGLQATLIPLNNKIFLASKSRHETTRPNFGRPSIAPGGCMPTGMGARVDRVMWNTPAFRAGLERGDIIVEIQGKRLLNANSMLQAIRNSGPWLQLKVINVRNGRPVDVWVWMDGGHDLHTAMMDSQ